MMRYWQTGALLALLSGVATADDWTASGELGIAATRGNSHSENVNAKFDFAHEGVDWSHKFGVSALRAETEVLVDEDGDGEFERRPELSANRYQLRRGKILPANSASERSAKIGMAE